MTHNADSGGRYLRRPDVLRALHAVENMAGRRLKNWEVKMLLAVWFR